jgi:hypothetical protein
VASQPRAPREIEMTAEVLAFESAGRPRERQALMAAIVELHALVALDPVLGAAPVRVYFVVNPHARQRIESCFSGPDRRRPDGAYAMVAYDFPFALELLKSIAPSVDEDRAKTLIETSAEMQEATLVRAAAAIGVHIHPLPKVDTEPLKAAFFPNTQEEVTRVFWFDLADA